jgi:hypothetical protein
VERRRSHWAGEATRGRSAGDADQALSKIIVSRSDLAAQLGEGRTIDVVDLVR